MTFLQIEASNVNFLKQDEISALNDIANPKEQPELKFECKKNIKNFIMFLLRAKKDKTEKNNS